MVESPSQRVGRGHEVLQKGVGGVGRPSWRAKRGWEVLQEGWKRLGGTEGVESSSQRAGKIRNPSLRAGMVLEDLPKGRERL